MNDDPYRLTTTRELFDRLLTAQHEREADREEGEWGMKRERAKKGKWEWLRRRVGLA